MYNPFPIRRQDCTWNVDELFKKLNEPVISHSHHIPWLRISIIVIICLIALTILISLLVLYCKCRAKLKTSLQQIPSCLRNIWTSGRRNKTPASLLPSYLFTVPRDSTTPKLTRLRPHDSEALTEIRVEAETSSQQHHTPKTSCTS